MFECSTLNPNIERTLMKTWRVVKSEMQDNFNNFQEILEKYGTNMTLQIQKKQVTSNSVKMKHDAQSETNSHS